MLLPCGLGLTRSGIFHAAIEDDACLGEIKGNRGGCVRATSGSAITYALSHARRRRRSCARLSRCHRPILTCMHSCRRRWPVRGNWNRRLRSERQHFICGQMTPTIGTTWACWRQGRAGLAKRGRISFGLCNSRPIMRRRAAICSVCRPPEILISFRSCAQLCAR